MSLERLSSALADRYRLERELGAGGMATVYLAQDLKHDRQVALKVLRPELAAVIGAERFLHEIKTTANLQHPHILPLFDSGSVYGPDKSGLYLFYVMPYVEGVSLRDRMSREKQLPIGEATRIASEVAAALDYAHRHGVIHRDIKPENILLHDGSALVADFGIALAASKAGSRMTETGMSLGTPQYMSPEQAMGERELDARSDVYALGCVTYEMLTGEPPFSGPTAQAIVAKVMTAEPADATSLRKTIPGHVADAVHTALQKLPADRFASAREFAEALAGQAPAGGTRRTRTPAAAVPTARTARTALFAALAAAAVLALVAAWGWLRLPAAVVPASPTVRFTLQFGDSIRPVDAPGSPVAVSPDGSRIAFLADVGSGEGWLYLRGMDQIKPTRVPGTWGAVVPFFSPQGDAIGYFLNGQLRWTPVAGGPSTLITETGYPQGVSWGADGRLVLSVNGALQRVPVGGGAMETLLTPDDAGGADLRWPDLSVDGRTMFFTMVDSAGRATLAGMALDDRRVVPLGVAGMSPRHVATGHLVWVNSDGTMMAAPVDARRIALTGPPELVTDGIRTGPAFVGKFGLARTGALAFMGGEAISTELVVMGGDGRVSRLPVPHDHFRRPRLSPEGRRIAMEIVYAQVSYSADIWVLDLPSLTMLRLTADSGSRSPDWSPDGRSIVYFTVGDQVNRVPANGSGLPETLFSWPRVSRIVSVPDGRHLLIQGSGSGQDIWLAPMDTSAAPRALLSSAASERNVALSATGEWLAYESTETGRAEIYLRRLEEGSGKLPVSRGGGANPRWSRSGQDLYFRRGDSLFVSTIPAGPDPTPTPPRLFGVLPGLSILPDFDVMPDGRILAARYDLGNVLPGLQVLLHRFEHLGGPAAGRTRDD